ncbi:hypothetical protein TNCT_643491 [Trichonephila clavata]|uniref:Uncharacterized protein n=1 Tax=Trichonephila clavata TaxID=2740835 RepID=A0A8X6KS12_TRICU|nr:hypothetical protein TNCT_643491 [Trichonephila clavata]
MRETVDTDLGIMELKQKLMLSKAAEEEVRLKAQEEARLKALEEAKAVEERRNSQEERKMNERIALWKTRLEKERWLVQEQMKQAQEHKMRMKAEKQKHLQEERCKRMEE